MPFKRKKLLNRLLLITFFASLVPLLFAGIYLIPKTGKETKKATREKLYSQSLLVSFRIEKQLLSPVRYFLHDLAITDRQLTEKRFAKIFAEYGEIKNFVLEIARIDPISGNKTQLFNIRQKDIPQFEPFNPGAFHDSIQVLQTRIAGKNDQTIFLKMGIKSESNTIYFLVVQLSQFFKSLGTEFAVGKIPLNYGIIDRKHQVLLFYFDPLGKQTISPQNPAVKTETAARNSDHFEIETTNSGKVLGAASEINSIVRWRVFTEIPENRLANPAKNIRFNFFLFIILGLLLSFFGTLYYSRRITGPINRFSRTATEIARGNFSQRIEVDSDDEIGRLARIFNYMAIELRRLNSMNLNKIITERTKTKTIIKNIGDGIIVTDENNRIVTVNSTVEKWFGIEEKNVVDKEIKLVFKEPSLLSLIDEVKETDIQGTFTRELSVLLPHQIKEKVFQGRATKIISQDEKIIGVVVIFRDITREKEVDLMKTELVSMVAHQLRSPLTSISGFSELLLEPGDNQETIREYANIIYQESVRLADLINKFLDISRIEAGKMDFKPKSIQIRDVLNDILHVASSDAQKKNIKLSVTVADEANDAFADSKMIAEVILNLLSNAIKYSPENTTVKLVVENDTNMTSIRVADQGYGISEKHLANIFTKFYRIKDDPRVGEERGTGLGLSLVKEIVELHKGQIHVDSQIGKGTTFVIKLPKKIQSAGWQP